MRFLVFLLGFSLLPGLYARAEGQALPDAEETFRHIAIDQFSLSVAALKQKTAAIAAQLQQKPKFEISDFPSLTYVALNFDTVAMQKLEPHYLKAQEFCQNDTGLAASCFLLDSAWKALTADSNEEFVQSLDPYYQQMTEASPKIYQLLVSVRWATLMIFVKRYQKSLEMVHRALKLVEELHLPDVYRVILYNNLSLIYAAFGEFDRAMEYILKTIDIAEQQGFQHVTAHYYLNASNMISRHLSEHDELTDVRKQELIQLLRSYISRAEAIDPAGVDRIFVAEQRAYAAFVEKDYKTARSLYQEVVKMQPTSESAAEAHFYLARTEWHEKNYERGLREAELGAKAMPAGNDSLRALYLQNKGDLLKSLGRFAEAAPIYAELATLQQRTFREQLHSKFTQNLIDSSLQLKEDEARRMERELAYAARVKQLLILVFGSLLASLVLLLVSLRQTRRLVRQNVYIIKQKDVIERQHQRMRLVFDNVQVGILEIDEELIIRGEHSLALSGLLHESGNLAGRSLKTILGGRMGLPLDHEAMFWSALDSILAEDQSSWDLNHHHLIHEVVFEGRLLQFRWQPIIVVGLVSRLILLISDVTLQNQMQRLQQESNQKAERQTGRIKELMLGSTERAIPLIKRLNAFMPNMGKPDILRDIHTLKGEARACGLRQLQEACHAFEDTLDIPEFLQVIREYQELSNFWQGPELHAVKNLAELVVPYLEDARRQLQAAGCPWLGFQVDDRVGEWDDASRRLLPVILLHGIGNAVDHGFVRPLHNGLASAGARFTVHADFFEQGYRLQLRDSGVGIDHQKVQTLALERRFTPEPGRPMTDVLFEEGVSTARVVNLTSGRGVGLSAVAAAAQELGGTARLLDNDQGKGSLLEIIWPESQQTRRRAQI